MARKRKNKKKRQKKDQAKSAGASESASEAQGSSETEEKGEKKPAGGASKRSSKAKSSKAKASKAKASKSKSPKSKSPKSKSPKSKAKSTGEEEQAAAVADRDDGDGEPVEDVDAVLDDIDDSEGLDELIAATVAGADPEDRPEEVAVTSLDEEPAAETFDGEPAAAVADEAPSRESEKEGPAEADEHSDVQASDAPPAAAGPGEEAEVRPDADIDLTGAIDLGPESTPELRDRLLAQALAHAELQEARYRVPYSMEQRAARWKGGIAGVILLAAAIVAVVPPAWVRPELPARLTAANRVQDIRSALLLQAQQVDAFRVRQQRLPSSLGELRERLPGIRYVRSGNRAYQLVAYGPDGNAILYDSIDPAPEFDRLVPGWAGSGTQ